MKTRTLLLVAVMILLPSVSYGQIGNLLKNRASKALHSVTRSTVKEANKEIDSVAQKSAEEMINNADSLSEENNQGNETGDKDKKAGQGINMGGLFGGKVDLKYNEEYKFNSRMYMQMEMYDKKDVRKMDYNIYFSSTNPSMAMETKNISTKEGESVPVSSRMVMDGENKCFLMLTDVNNMKMGIISAVPDENTIQSQNEEKQAETIKPPSITKTGNTKMIAGFKCDEYLVKEADEKEYSKMWFTKEEVIKVDSRAWTKSGMPSAYGYKDFEGGVIMGFESYDSDGKLSAKSEVKEVNKDYPHSVSVKGYSLRQMNFNQNQKK
jgi:hypothetical protein